MFSCVVLVDFRSCFCHTQIIKKVKGEDMSKRNKNAEIKISSGPNDTDENTELLVELKDKVIGTVREVDKSNFEAEYAIDGSKVKYPSIDEAVEHIVMMYNLHEM